MTSFGLGVFLAWIAPANAESACDSGCEAGRDWMVGPQLEAAVLPTNARLYVFDETTPSVLDSAGAEVPVSIAAAPESGVWVSPVTPWTAGATYTLVLDGGGTSDFVIGSAADEVAPTLSAVDLRTRDFSTCDASMPLVVLDPMDLEDDQTGPNEIFAEVRVAGAADEDARIIDPWGKELTVEEGDPCFPNLPGAHNGDMVTLELRFYDLAGNASNPVTAGPVELVVDDLHDGWADGDSGGKTSKGTTCGCAAGTTHPGALGLLAVLMLLRRSQRPR